MAEPAREPDWPMPDEIAQPYGSTAIEPVPPDPITVWLHDLEVQAQHRFRETTANVVSFASPVKDGTFRMVWNRKKPPPPPPPSAWKFWLWR